jgi:hypothetical protein
MERSETVLVYLGPSLPLAEAKAILPDAVYLAPAGQVDILSDVIRYSPTYIILIDGTFRDNLSVWHKEIVYALQYPGVKGIYGAASMGALRAAESDYLGMVGLGEIYGWYRDGITEDDSEVAVSYAEKDGRYHLNTVPLADIRAGVTRCIAQRPDLTEQAQGFLESMRQVFYMERTAERCEQSWDRLDVPFPCYGQKAQDAIEALTNFRNHEPAPVCTPVPEHLSPFFQALYERDRRIEVNGIPIPQQHIDAHVLLHNPEWERICWDSANQELALMLCNLLCVTVSVEEIQGENARFQQKSEIQTLEDFKCFLANNGWSQFEYDRLMIQNARIRKLQHHLTVTKSYRRNTQAIIDYLRTHQAFDYWAIQAAALEQRLQKRGADDWLSINLETPPIKQLLNHFETEGLELKSSPEDYLLETGFSNFTELSVAVQRTAAGKE